MLSDTQTGLLPASRMRPYHAPVAGIMESMRGDERRTNVLIVGGSLLLVLLATLGHYLTPSSAMPWHDTLRRLYYVPIAVIGVRYGLSAGLGIGILVACVYFPHIYTHWGGDPLGPTNLNRSLEVLLWILVGALTGLLSDRERSVAARLQVARDAAQQSAREAREATRSLLEVQEQLRHADRLATLGTLSAGLAHEIRNPLGSLRGIADMLRGDFDDDHPHKELVEILDREVARLDGVVSAFLESARPTASEGPAIVEAEAGAVAELLEYERQRRSAHVDVQVSPKALELPLPAELLRQVLLNVVLNALQSAGSEGRVVIQARQRGECRELVIEDDGPGFPDELAGAEVRPFFTTREHGTGLGLAISREIIESHGGKLTLENGPGGGARVVIRFGELAS